MLECLQRAFEPYRAHYTPGAYSDTVPTRESVARRFDTMTILVAEDEAGRALGTIACSVRAAGHGHLRGMAVVPEWQGRGVADRLLQAAESELRAKGCTRVTLDTTDPLQRAMRFYERAGFQRTGRIRDFYGMPLYEFAKRLE